MVCILKQIADLFLNRYVGFYFGFLVFFMPVFYRIRLLFEEKRHVNLRSQAMLNLCNSEPDWMTDESLALSTVNESRKPFAFVNAISQELFSVKLFENNEPTEESGFTDCKMISMYSFNHFVELYNKSLFSGFWSLIFKPLILLDEQYFKISIFKDKNNEFKKMIIVIKFDNDYVRIFKFVKELSIK